MIGIEERKVAEIVQRLMRKFEVRLATSNRFDNGTVRDSTQCQNNRISWQMAQFIGKKEVAGIDFGTDRLVVGRQTLNGVRNTTSG